METLKSFLPERCGRAFAFSTFVDSQLRTVGLGFVLPKEWNHLSNWNETDAQTLCRMFDPMQHSEAAAARGKIFFVGSSDGLGDRKAVCSCYQVKGIEAIPVFCGNSSSATAAVISELTNLHEFAFQFICEKWSVEVIAHVSRSENGWQVGQTWQIENDVNIIELDVLGHKSVLCSFLNDYLIVKGPLNVDVSLIISSEHGIKSLRSKVAIIDESPSIPVIRFYNCNGQHGAAPQTGLATIGIVAQNVPWLAKAIKTRRVETPGGVELIPEINTHNNLMSFDMPKRIVQLKELTQHE